MNIRAVSVGYLDIHEDVWGPLSYEDFCDDNWDDYWDD